MFALFSLSLLQLNQLFVESSISFSSSKLISLALDPLFLSVIPSANSKVLPSLWRVLLWVKVAEVPNAALRKTMPGYGYPHMGLPTPRESILKRDYLFSICQLVLNNFMATSSNSIEGQPLQQDTEKSSAQVTKGLSQDPALLKNFTGINLLHKGHQSLYGRLATIQASQEDISAAVP